jgi:O-antigen/teichoic acid export membrane protein
LTHESLKFKTVQALGWSLAESIGQRGIQFLIGIVLARLLLPEQFGLIGMLTVFIAIAQTFLDSGFGAALIQKKTITEKDTNSIFYFNILIGLIVAGCLFGISPWVAIFYRQPALERLLQVMSLMLVINAFGLVQRVLLTRSLDFKTQTKVSLISSSLSGCIGISMAWQGYGVWSLAGQQISSAMLQVALLWLFNHWRPSRIFSIQSLQEMFRFGSKLLASGLLNTIFENIYLIVIGKLFSPADLGYFTRANNLQQLPSRTLSGMIARVALPVFSSIQDDQKRVKQGMKKALTALVLVNFPMMIGLAVVARPLVLVLLTEKWLPCVPYLQLLSLVGLMFPLHLINLNVLQAMGRSDLFLRLEIIKKTIVALNIAITWRWGIMAMIFGQIVTSIVSYYLNAYYNKALLNYSIWEQICDLYPYLFSALMMGCAIYLLIYLPITSPILLLICQVATGGVVYLLVCRLFRLSVFMELQQMIINRLSPKTTST